MMKWIGKSILCLGMTLAIFSCNKKEKEPQYKCDLNSPNYINLTVNENNFKTGGNNIAGGFMRITENVKSQSLYEVSFFRDDVVNNVYIKFDSLVTAGTYNLGENIEQATFMYDKADVKVPFTELSFNVSNIDERLELTNYDNIQYYSYVSGSFEGKYVHPVSKDTITVVGTYCSDPVAE